MTTKERVEQLITDIKNTDSKLWHYDVCPCDGMNDECCGGGGNNLDEYELVEYIKELFNVK